VCVGLKNAAFWDIGTDVSGNISPCLLSVEVLVKELRYKSEGRRFDFPSDRWIYQYDLIFSTAL
jgi:hypothetical protein